MRKDINEFEYSEEFRKLFFENPYLNGLNLNQKLCYIAQMMTKILFKSDKNQSGLATRKKPHLIRNNAEIFFKPDFYEYGLNDLAYILEYNYGHKNILRYEMELFHSHIIYLLDKNADINIIIDYIVMWFDEMWYFTSHSTQRKVIGLNIVVTSDRNHQKQLFMQRMQKCGIPKKYWYKSAIPKA